MILASAAVGGSSGRVLDIISQAVARQCQPIDGIDNWSGVEPRILVVGVFVVDLELDGLGTAGGKIGSACRPGR